MYIKEIKYTDYNGEERTEQFMFNMTKAEIFEKQFGTVGGFDTMLKRIADTKDLPKLIAIMKELILGTYGEKSADGRRFVKSDELSREFSQTEAYSNLYMELATDAKAAADFINGVVPSDVAAKAASLTEAEKAKILGGLPSSAD